jgi:hypothetical protein
MAIFGHGVTFLNPQNKVSSCFRVYILQPWTPDSPLDRCIHTNFGNIVHEGRYRRDFTIADNDVVVIMIFLYLWYVCDDDFYIYGVLYVHTFGSGFRPS